MVLSVVCVMLTLVIYCMCGSVLAVYCGLSVVCVMLTLVIYCMCISVLAVDCGIVHCTCYVDFSYLLYVY